MDSNQSILNFKHKVKIEQRLKLTWFTNQKTKSSFVKVYNLKKYGPHSVPYLKVSVMIHSLTRMSKACFITFGSF